jgi:release factor glutamine methyltransferase
VSVADAIREATARLASTSDTARLDAELLMAHALGVSRSDVLVRHMRDAVPGGFDALVERRANHEPVAYITGWTEFYGRRFDVEPGVLIPRGDSEVLIEAALELCPDPRRVLDMGAGSGALLLTVLAERPSAFGVGVDASDVAIKVTQKNAVALDLPNDWRIERRSWHDAGWADDLSAFDLILCNPPYVEEDAALDPDVRDYEPASALFSGREGLDDYRAIIPQLGKLLMQGGIAILEIGHTQAEAVSVIAKNHGFSVEIRNDLANRPRCLILIPTNCR